MANHPPAARRRWQATIIITLFILAVAGAAFTGWRFARDSAPHQGPIVLISIDGLRADALASYGARPGATPNIDALAQDGIVFERAYTHSPLSLPAHAALLSGQLPFDNGVRDNAGYALKNQARTIATLLRSRGFNTGAAISSFVLRRSTGLAQGFTFYDADLPDVPLENGVLSQRSGLATFDAADKWIKAQSGQRYFLFLEVDAAASDAVVGKLVDELKRTRRYDEATIVLTADHGDASSGATIDDSSLHVPFIIKQPGALGSGRRVTQPVQHIDLLPTLLDLVRAPMPAGLRGRSLRAILDKTTGIVPDQPIYAEFVAPALRFGGQPLFALSNSAYRIVQGFDDQLQPLTPDASAPDAASIESLKTTLEKMVAGRAIEPPAAVPEADEDRLAALGYMQGLRAPFAPVAPVAPIAHPSDAPLAPFSPLAPLAPTDQASVWTSHRQAAALIAQRKFPIALDLLRGIVASHPELVSVHFQLASLLARAGRTDDAIKMFALVAVRRPDDAQVPVVMADALLHARRLDDAATQADQAVMLADAGKDAVMIAAAHEMAARVALARGDVDAATTHADAAQKADPRSAMPQFVRGRIAYDAGNYADAVAAFKEAVAVVAKSANDSNVSNVSELHLYLGNTYARLDDYNEAEAEFHEELREFPQDIATYASLATLYRASNRDQAVERVIDDLVGAAPTPEGYSMAARLWTIVGDRARADGLRADARRRFKGDPSLALLGRAR
jgi:tetratricopeptide (TPR) repeat protein